MIRSANSHFVDGLREKILYVACGAIVGFSIPLLLFFPNSNVVLYPRPKHKVEILAPQLYDDRLAQNLYKEVRLLCWILTGPENHHTKAFYVKQTWGKRCNKLLFMSSAKDPNFETVALPVDEGRDNLWDKTKRAFEYIYKHHYEDYDWFMKADDDNFVIPENVRYMLSFYHSQTALYFGHRYSVEVNQEGYMAGGGYILSKAALKKLITKILPNETICSQDPVGNEDWELGRCLAHSALPVDSRDLNKQKRFFPTGLVDHLEKEVATDYWYYQTQYYEVPQGNLSCCSDTPAAFHYVSPQEMMALEYFILRVHPFGLEKNVTEQLPIKLSMEQIIKEADVESPSINYHKHELYHDIESSEVFRKRRSN